LIQITTMRLLYVLISFGLLISSSFSQDYSKNVARFRFNSEFDSIQKEHVFTYKLPTDGYSFQISLDSKVVPVAMFIKYKDLEVWSGFVGQRASDLHKQIDLSLEEKIRLLKIQSPDIRSFLESRIQSSLPDPKKISGGIVGEKYLIVDTNGKKLVTFKKVEDNIFNFRSNPNVPLLTDKSSENSIIFSGDYINYIYKDLNIDPSTQSLIITEGKKRDRIDNGTCVLVDKPAEFYLDYFSGMNLRNRNFIGELIYYKENYGLMEQINSAIRGVGGKEITSIFQNGDEHAVKATEKIVGGSVFFTDGSSYGEILSSENTFTFNKKGEVDEITIFVFTPLEESSFAINLNQIPEGLNQIFYKSGQLKEEYTLQYGTLNGEKITYYEDKNYKIGQDTKPIKEITTYLNGSKTGIHKEYELNQNLVLEEDLKDGIKNGKYKKCVNGKVIEEGNYVNNEKEGEWTIQNSSEKITQNYSKGKLNGASKKYNNDVLVETGQFMNGLMTGVWKFYYLNGKIKGEGSFTNGDGGNSGKASGIPKNGREGSWILYHENGNKQQVCSYEKGGVQGSFFKYHANGKISHNLTYKNDTLNGDCFTFFESGVLECSEFYINGKRSGEFTRYYETGEISEQGIYVDGKFEGTYMYHLKNGNKCIGTMKNGTMDYIGSTAKVYAIDGSIFDAYYENGQWYKQKSTEQLNEEIDKFDTAVTCEWCNKSFKAIDGYMFRYAGSMECNREYDNSLKLKTVDVDDIYSKSFCSKKCAHNYCDAQ
jgi:antitoxin component YwqK of YwqJK toxin-antitoxin module